MPCRWSPCTLQPTATPLRRLIVVGVLLVLLSFPLGLALYVLTDTSATGRHEERGARTLTDTLFDSLESLILSEALAQEACQVNTDHYSHHTHTLTGPHPEQGVGVRVGCG